jgi:Na+-translocating ferredoxin:NAD+ oxidoreductase RnfA subunit
MAVAAVCLVLPPLRNWAIYPLTDTWGAALLAAGLLAGLSVVEHGAKRLPLWILVVAALAFTRDIAFILVVAALTLLVFTRTRRAALLTGTGILAALPAPLFLGGVPVRQLLAYVFNDINVPKDDSWGAVLRGYGPDVRHMLDGYANYVPGHLAVTAVFVAGVAMLLLARGRRDPLLLLARGAALGYAAFLVIAPTFSAFRYEIALIPMVAVGLGFGFEWVRVRIAPWIEAHVFPRLGMPAPAAGNDGGLGAIR